MKTFIKTLIVVVAIGLLVPAVSIAGTKEHKDTKSKYHSMDKKTMEEMHEMMPKMMRHMMGMMNDMMGMMKGMVQNGDDKEKLNDMMNHMDMMMKSYDKPTTKGKEDKKMEKEKGQDNHEHGKE